MEAIVEQEERKKPEGKRSAAHQQIRGSSLLLTGKLISVGINFVSQVLMVRFLTAMDYGAFAYALAVVDYFQHFSSLGLRLGVPRFAPIFHERKEFGKLFGTMLLAAITLAATALVIIGAIFAAPEQVARLVNEGHQSLSLLFILIFVVPVEAIDDILIALLASFASPRAIFFRRYILTPGLKFVVILSMVLMGSDVVFLAYGYLMAGALGVAIYIGVFINVLRQRGILQHFRIQNLRLPARELFGFSLPMLASDLLIGLTPFAATALLGYFHDPKAVAFFRVVLPLAHLNRIVKMSFETLYTPTAARLYAKSDYAGVNDLYWQTAIWMAVLSFPMFAVTFSAAQPLTLLLYGAQYQEAWLNLALLSFSHYFAAAFGFNTLTLRVVGKIRYVVILDILTAALHLAASLWLISRYGARGAAIAIAITMILNTALKQAGLRMIPGMNFLNKKYLTFYLFVGVSALGLFAFQFFTASSIYVTLPLVAAAAFLVLRVGKRNLHIAETFPELLKRPLMKWLLT